MPSELAKQVGKNIRSLRKDRGWTQEELAYRSGMAMRHLGRIERADVSPTLDALEKMAAALGIHPGDLLRGS